MTCQDIPARPLEVIGADMFTLNNKHYLCITDHHSKFPVIKKTEDLSADSLIITCEVTFVEYRLLKKIMLESGGNFISDKFKTFCKSLCIEQTSSSSYHHCSNGQVEACIKFVKCILKKCLESKGDPHITLLQIHMTQLGPGLPSPGTMLFYCPIRGIMPTINRPLVGRDKHEEHYEVLIKIQTENDKNQDTPRNYVSIPIGSIVVVQHEDGGLWTLGTVEGIGDHNHHERSYNIHITRTG